MDQAESLVEEEDLEVIITLLEETEMTTVSNPMMNIKKIMTGTSHIIEATQVEVQVS